MSQSSSESGDAGPVDASLAAHHRPRASIRDAGMASDLAQGLWQAFAEMNDLERRLWVAYMWRGEALSKVARQHGLSVTGVRAQLVATARAMDARLSRVRTRSGAGLHSGQVVVRGRFETALEKQLGRFARPRKDDLLRQIVAEPGRRDDLPHPDWRLLRDTGIQPT